MIASAEQFRESCQLARTSHGRVMLYVRGERYYSNAEEITACGRLALCRYATPRLAIDLSGVSFIDACSIGALITLHLGVRRRGCPVYLLNAPDPSPPHT